MAFLLWPLVPLHSSCGSLFVPSRCALWHCQWLPLGDTHYPLCPLFIHLPAIISLFFSMYSLVIHKSHSSSGLCTTAVRRQLNAVASVPTAPHVQMNCWFCVSFSSTKKPLHLCAHMSDPRSINSRRPIISWVCDILYTQAVSCAPRVFFPTQLHSVLYQLSCLPRHHRQKMGLLL